MSMGISEMLGENTIPPGLDDLILEGSTGRDPTSDPTRRIMASGTRQQTAHKEETSDTSETVPQPMPQATVHIATLERMMQMFKSSQRRGQQERLARMPQVPNDPSVTRRHWKQWYDVLRLRSWANAQREEFDEAFDLYIRTKNPRQLQEFDRENRMLAYEICNQLDDKILLVEQPHDNVTVHFSCG